MAAQKLMRTGQLRAARKQLILCAKDCLPEVERDCTTWLTEVGSSMPTLVVVALDAQGKELSDVSVHLGEEQLVSRLDGRALDIDPGPQQLSLRRGDVERTLKLTVRQGEKNRRVEVRFPEVAASGLGQLEPDQPAEPRATAPPKETHWEKAPDQPLPQAAWIFGGVGAVSLVGAAYFWLAAENLRQDLLDRGCAPRCPEGDQSSIDRRRLIGDVLLGVSAVSIGVFGYYWLTHGPVGGPTQGGAWAGYRARF